VIIPNMSLVMTIGWPPCPAVGKFSGREHPGRMSSWGDRSCRDFCDAATSQFQLLTLYNCHLLELFDLSDQIHAVSALTMSQYAVFLDSNST